MANACITVEFDGGVKEVENDCSACYFCKDIIYGKQYGYLITITYELNGIVTRKHKNKRALCQSCADAINNSKRKGE